MVVGPWVVDLVEANREKGRKGSTTEDNEDTSQEEKLQTLHDGSVVDRELGVIHKLYHSVVDGLDQVEEGRQDAEVPKVLRNISYIKLFPFSSSEGPMMSALGSSLRL